VKDLIVVPDLNKIASLTRQAIDDYSLQLLKGDRRKHLGASEIFNPCRRKLWYGFRWVRERTWPARMLRLFNRGHKEESRIIDWLRGAGYVVYETDPLTAKQWQFSEYGEHYGGSCDGLASHPTYFPDQYIILEFKTHNEKSFKALQKEGVKKVKPEHYAQMSIYGRNFNCRVGLYAAVNKNDDDLHIELVELDWRLADEFSEKARQVVFATIPPPRFHGAQPSHYICKGCEHLDVCFHKAPPDPNCRSCVNAVPIEGAKWGCNLWRKEIPEDFIPKGCSAYRSIC
jgi:hypothetical protein